MEAESGTGYLSEIQEGKKKFLRARTGSSAGRIHARREEQRRLSAFGGRSGRGQSWACVLAGVGLALWLGALVARARQWSTKTKVVEVFIQAPDVSKIGRAKLLVFLSVLYREGRSGLLQFLFFFANMIATISICYTVDFIEYEYHFILFRFH
jgi:hypothetical protein